MRRPAQGMLALDAAVAAQADWAATDPRFRGEILRKAFELLIERADEFALLMTLEMGKPLAEARGEVTYGAEFFRWFSEEAVRIAGRYAIAPSGGTRLLTMKQPVGPVFAITPWNFPLAMGTRKIGPALAAGCTVVIKPAAQTPLTTLALAKVLTEAGVPDGRGQCGHHLPLRRAVGADHPRPAAAQADLHRIDPGRPAADRAVSAAGAQGQHGTRRQRPVRGVRRRESRSRRRRRDAGEDAEHRRGLHGRQPVHRARIGGRRVRRAVGTADGRHGHRAGHRRRRPGRTAGGCGCGAKGLGAGGQCARLRRQGAHRREDGGGPGIFLRPDGADRCPAHGGHVPPGDLRAGGSHHHLRQRRTRASRWPTTPNTVWWPTPSPRT